MTQRSYRQYCSLARALDLVGERWTLLVIRDLLTGPKRYKELLAGLPGIGTNLLAARLKQLVEAGLVEHDPEEGRGIYRLAPAGQELEDAIVALARFGASRMGSKTKDDLWRPIWTTLALQARFQAERAAGVDETYEFRVDEETFHATVRDGTVECAHGPSEDAQLAIETDEKNFLAWATGRLSAREIKSSPRFRIRGTLRTLERCERLFGAGAKS